jgi:hypothetical protein
VKRIAVFMSLALLAFASSCEVDQKKREREKKLDRYYELQWVECVNELGIERCKIIQETGFRQCQNFRSGQDAGVSACAEERFEDRMKEVVADPDVVVDQRGAPDVVTPEDPNAEVPKP